MSSDKDVGIPDSKWAYVKGVGVGEMTRESWLKACFPEWGTWLNKQIERTRVQSGSFNLWWTGACGFFLKTAEANILIDHYSGPSFHTDLEDGCGVCRQTGAERVDWLRTFPHVIDPWAIKQLDAVLVTHIHPDHLDPYTIVPLAKNTDARFFGPQRVCSKFREFGVKEDKIVEVSWGDSVEVKDSTVMATETADKSVLFSGREMPKTMEEAAVCWLIQTPAGSIFHVGDTHYANLFYRIGLEHSIDVALVQFGGNPPGVRDKMTPYDAFRVAEALKAKVLIPMHYDWAVTQGDPYELEWIAKRQAPWMKTVIMQPGCQFEYPADINIGRCKYPRFAERWRPKLSWEYGDQRKIQI
jgi:L-ascorbate 6-phosphate lactonase